MRHLRALMESHPSRERRPDQSLLASPAGSGLDHTRAILSADGRWAMVYVPTGRPVTVRLDKLSGPSVKASWHDPRTGGVESAGRRANRGEAEFDPPGSPGPGNDWVLVLDSVPRRE
ncbi:MAG: putative collagen-binding domain-containing protein [Candidatus Coatesbacteria bacterium]